MNDEKNMLYCVMVLFILFFNFTFLSVLIYILPVLSRNNFPVREINILDKIINNISAISIKFLKEN